MNNLPPISYTPNNVPDACIAKLKISSIGDVKSIRGNLDRWNVPVVDVFMKNENVSIKLKALIDTSSYYSHVKNWVVEKLNVSPSHFASGNNPQYGIITTPTFDIEYSIGGIEAEMVSNFMILLPGFDYDVILGSHIFDQFDLVVNSSDKSFSLEVK